MAAHESVSLTINAITTGLRKELDAAAAKVDELTKRFNTQRDALRKEKKQIDENIAAYQKAQAEMDGLSQKEKNRLDRIDEAIKKRKEETKAEKEYLNAVQARTKAVDDAEKRLQKAELERDEQRKRSIDSVAAKDEDFWKRQEAFQKGVIERETQRERDRVAQINQINRDAYAERLRAQREYVRQSTNIDKDRDLTPEQIRANVLAARNTSTTRDLVSRRQMGRVGTSVDSPWNERAAAALSSRIDKVKSSFNELNTVWQRTKLRAEDNNTLFGKLAHSGDEASKASRRLELRLGRLGRTMLGLGIAGVITFMQSFASTLTAVGGQAIALVGSIGNAATAIGGTLVSAIAQAIPMLGVFGAALSRLSIIGNAIQQYDLTQKQMPGQDTSNADAAKQATDAITNAQKDQKQATEDLTQARQDAVRELQDLIAAEREAELAMRGAMLTQKEAHQQLQDAIQSGDVGGIDRAQLAVDEAKLGVRSARTDLSRSRQDANKARQGGVENMPAMVDATNRLADANKALADAHDQAATAATDQSAAESYLQYYLSQLTDTERKLYETVIDFRTKLKKLASDISQPLLQSFIYAIHKIEDLVFNNKIIDGMKKLAKGMGDVVRGLVDEVTSDRSINFWTKTIGNAKDNLGPIEDILKNVYRLFMNIANGAAPILHKILKLIADETERWQKGTRNNSEITDFFQAGLRNLRAWYRLLLGVIDLFDALMGASSHSAIKTLDDFTKRLHDGADAIRNSGNDAKKFFDETSKAFGYIIDVVVELGKELVRSFSPDSVKALRDILVNVIIPALGEAIRVTGKLAIFLDRAFEGPLGTFAKFAIAFKIVTGSLNLLKDLIFAAFGPLSRLVTFIGFVVEAFKAWSAGTLVLSAGLETLLVATGIGAVIAAITLLLWKLGLLDDVWAWMKQAASDIADFFAKELGPTIEDLGKTFGLLWDDIKFVIKRIVQFFRWAFSGNSGVIGKVLNGLKDVFASFFIKYLKTLWNFWKETFQNFVQVFKGLVNFLDDLIHGRWDQLWGDFKDILKGVFDQVLNILDTVTQPFEDAGKAIVNALADGFKWAYNHVLMPYLNFMIDKINGVADFIDSITPGETFGQITRLTPMGNSENTDKKGVDSATESFVKNSKAKEENALATSRLNDQLILHGQANKQVTATTEDNTDKTNKGKKAVDDFSNAVSQGTKESKGFEKQTKDTGKQQDSQGESTKNLAKKLGILKGTLFGSGKQSENLGETIKNVTNGILKEFGVDELKFSIPKTAKIVSDAIGDVGSAMGFQTGGWFGSPNERKQDDRTIRVAGGEAILTAHQQRIANDGLAVAKAMGAVPYGHLGEMFAKERRPHSTAGFNRGGSVPMVNTLGAHPAVSRFVSELMAKYGGSIGSGLRAGDTGSLHSTGQAIDYSPSDWSGASRAVNAVGPSLLEGIYNPATYGGQPVSWDTGQHVDSSFWGAEWGNHLDHIHIAIADGAKVAAKGVASVGAAIAAHIGKIKIKGKDGPLKDLLQGQSDKLVAAANKKVGKLAGSAGGFITGGKGSVISQMARILLGSGLDAEAAAGIIGNALQESGWSTTADDGSGNGGLFGFTSGEKSMASLRAYAEKVNQPWDAVDTQVNFMLSTLSPTTKAHLNAASSIADTTAIFMNEWELPYIPTANLPRRIDGAAQALEIIRKLSGKRSGGGGGGAFQRGGIPSFDDGGVVPGPRGKKQLVFAHGGETFVPTHKDSFASGGPVQQAFASVKDIFSAFSRPSASVTTGNEDNWRSDWKDRILKAIEDLLRDGGALDDLATAIEAQITNLENNLNSWQLKITRWGVANIRTASDIAKRTLRNLEKVGKSYQKESEMLEDAMKFVEKRINSSKSVDERQKWRASLTNLENRYRELQTTMNDNLSARLDAQAAIFDSAIARLDQMKGYLDTRRQIMELKAEIEGRDLTGSAYTNLYKDTGKILRREQNRIRNELRDARKSGDIDRARELRQTLLDNKLAILENTKALKDAKGAIQKTFSFNSLPWQLYRQAILNGSGGLIPPVGGTIPSLASGGVITADGLVNLHAGEVVTPADKVAGNVEINFTQPMEVADPEAISSAIAWKLKTQT